MQSVYYIDHTFVKENSTQYILSIRYSTDGLSFCIHDHNNKLLAFFYQPFSLDTKDAVIAKVKKIIVDEEVLNLKYKKVYILPCNKEKYYCRHTHSAKNISPTCTGYAFNRKRTTPCSTGRSKSWKATSWKHFPGIL